MFGSDKVNIEELDEIKEKSKEDAKTKFHIEHLQKWFEFVQYKYECTINVIEIQDKNAHLITSDNPVVIRELNSNQFAGIFNPNNVITLPLDPNHFLEIHPNTVANNEYKIRRFIHDKDYVFTTNSMTQQNSENLLIGKKDTIGYHFKLQDVYENNDNPEKFVDKAKFKLNSLKLFVKMCEEKGPNSKEAINQLKKIYSHPYFKNDEQIKKYVKQYRRMGYL